MSTTARPFSGVGAELLAIPVAGGGYHAVQVQLRFVEGLLHKMSIPGCEVRSGESMGLSATFLIAADLDHRPTGRFARIRQLTYVNGERKAVETIADNAPIVELHP